MPGNPLVFFWCLIFTLRKVVTTSGRRGNRRGNVLHKRHLPLENGGNTSHHLLSSVGIRDSGASSQVRVSSQLSALVDLFGALRPIAAFSPARTRVHLHAGTPSRSRSQPLLLSALTAKASTHPGDLSASPPSFLYFDFLDRHFWGWAISDGDRNPHLPLLRETLRTLLEHSEMSGRESANSDRKPSEIQQYQSPALLVRVDVFRGGEKSRTRRFADAVRFLVEELADTWGLQLKTELLLVEGGFCTTISRLEGVLQNPDKRWVLELHEGATRDGIGKAEVPSPSPRSNAGGAPTGTQQEYWLQIKDSLLHQVRTMGDCPNVLLVTFTAGFYMINEMYREISMCSERGDLFSDTFGRYPIIVEVEAGDSMGGTVQGKSGVLSEAIPAPNSRAASSAGMQTATVNGINSPSYRWAWQSVTGALQLPLLAQRPLSSELQEFFSQRELSGFQQTRTLCLLSSTGNHSSRDAQILQELLIDNENLWIVADMHISKESACLLQHPRFFHKKGYEEYAQLVPQCDVVGHGCGAGSVFWASYFGKLQFRWKADMEVGLDKSKNWQVIQNWIHINDLPALCNSHESSLCRKSYLQKMLFSPEEEWPGVQERVKDLQHAYREEHGDLLETGRNARSTKVALDVVSRMLRRLEIGVGFESKVREIEGHTHEDEERLKEGIRHDVREQLAKLHGYDDSLYDRSYNMLPEEEVNVTVRKIVGRLCVLALFLALLSMLAHVVFR